MVVQLIETGELIDLDELKLFGEDELRECDEETMERKWKSHEDAYAETGGVYEE